MPRSDWRRGKSVAEVQDARPVDSSGESVRSHPVRRLSWQQGIDRGLRARRPAVTARPIVTWIGCVLAPDPIGLNAVVGLSDGGFVATNFSGREEVAGTPAGKRGRDHRRAVGMAQGTGWKTIPGSETSGPNGVELSNDGKWLYMAAFGSQSLVRLSRGQASVKRDSVPLGFRVDNIRWAPDGSLFAAGPGGVAPAQASNIVKVDPNTLKVQRSFATRTTTHSASAP